MKNRKLKLAYISPLSPEKSGISFYSKELIPYLSEYYEITLVVDQEKVDSEITKKYRVIQYKDFMKSFKTFDRILCHFGNSAFHKHMLYLIEEIPCVIVLHDVFLSGLIDWAHHTNYYPNILFEEAYYSHGWTSLIDLKKDLYNFLMNYPLNKRVINNSLGIIIHSSYALELIKKYYAEVRRDKFEVIPHVRKVQKDIYEENQEEFLISSFGHITPFKLPEILIEGFALSEVSKLPNTKLLFVGEPLTPDYEDKLLNLAEGLGIEDKVKITGFVDENTYKDYLRKSSICIQLRTNSRGETSRAVLDVLAYGKPLILNFYASFKDFPEEVVYFVSEEPKPKEITQAINKLYLDKSLRDKLSNKAVEYIEKNHNPEKVAQKFYEAIERFYKEDSLIEVLKNVSKIVETKNDAKFLASLLKKNFNPIVANKTIYVDVSAICMHDLGTGIQRVVKAQLKGLIENPPDGYRIEPIRLTDEDKRWSFKYARNYTRHFLNINIPELDVLTDKEVDFKKGDIYYAPDLFGGGMVEGYKAGVYDEMILNGVKVVFLVYDLLPIEFPQYFPPGADEAHANYIKAVLKVSDMVICISNATAESLKNFAKKEGIERPDLKIEVLHLGSDIAKAKHKDGIGAEELAFFDKISKNPYFLMVSTVEPRKGHYQVIKAMEILWDKGYEIGLVIVGKEGWMIENVVNYIKRHPQFNQRLFWPGYVSDGLLEKLYANALATIIASEGEGFGLSIIESAYYGTPIIARDIPVFREVAGKGAYYFPNTKDPLPLAEALERWLSLYKENNHPKPDQIKWLSWEENVEKLKRLLTSFE